MSASTSTSKSREQREAEEYLSKYKLNEIFQVSYSIKLTCLSRLAYSWLTPARGPTSRVPGECSDARGSPRRATVVIKVL